MGSELIDFLLEKGKNHKGKSFKKVLKCSDQRLERTAKDILPWLFPVDAETEDNKVAPVLNLADLHVLRNNLVVQGAIKMAVVRLIWYFEASKIWLVPKSPMYITIARILRCLWLANMRHDYVLFQKSLDGAFVQFPNVIGEETYFYWKMMNNDEFFKTYPLTIPYEVMFNIANPIEDSVPVGKTVGEASDDMMAAMCGFGYT